MGQSLTNGLNIMGSVAGGMLRTAGEFAGNILSLNPMGAVDSAIRNIDTTVSRVKHYAAGGDGDGLAGLKHLTEGVAAVGGTKVMKDALASGFGGAVPPSVVKMAQVGSHFYDGLAKHGDIVAAAKYAGATPITQHLANSMSNHVATFIKSKTGFDAKNHQLLSNPVMMHVGHVSTQNNNFHKLEDIRNGGGVEAMAMKNVAKIGKDRADSAAASAAVASEGGVVMGGGG